MSSLFNASEIKIKRARMLIDELRGRLHSHLENGGFRSRVFMQDGEIVAEATVSSDEMSGAIVGDIFHNARSALDLMAVELAEISNKNTKDVYFPLSADAETLSARIKSKHFDRCGEDAVALLRQLEPYKGGNDYLRALHDLNIIDKHISLISTFATFETTIDLPFDEGGIDISRSQVSIVSDTVRYRFPDDGPFAGSDLFETLEKLVELSDGIVGSFDQLVRERNVS